MSVLVDGKSVEELANGEVHIPFNTEYTLRFRNKHNRRASVKFWIDGELCSGEGYIIPSNSYVDIVRHNKVDAAFVLVPLDSEEARAAGKDGPNKNRQKGVIKAEFTLERTKPRKQFIPLPCPQPWITPYPKPWKQPEIWCFNTSMGSLNRSGTTCSNGPMVSTKLSCSTEDSYTIQDGCTVQGGTTGQQFSYTSFDPEDSSTTIQLFLRGYDSGKTFPSKKDVDLEKENARLREEINRRKKLKDLMDENQKLKEELEKYKGV